MPHILVKAPLETEDLISSFPFFKRLRDNFTNEKISVLVDDGNQNILRSLDCNLEEYVLPKNKKNILSGHKVAMNLKDVFNVDTYIDLESTMHSMVLGRSFRPAEVIGFTNGMNKLFLTKKVEINKSLKQDARYLTLLDNEKLAPLKIFFEDSGEKESAANFFKAEESTPFLLFLIDDISKDSEYLNFWKNFIKKLSNQRIYLWSYEKSLELNEIKAEVEKTNELLIIDQPFLDLPEYIKKAKGVFTTNNWVGQLSAYFAVNSYIFVDSATTINFQEHFKFDPSAVEYDGKKMHKFISTDETVILDDDSQFFDNVCDTLKL